MSDENNSEIAKQTHFLCCLGDLLNDHIRDGLKPEAAYEQLLWFIANYHTLQPEITKSFQPLGADQRVG